MDAKSHNGLDAIALIVAIALHAALIAALLLQGTTRETIPEPKRITVNFAEDVGMTSAAPDPVKESQASVSPELGEQAPPPIATLPPPPLPQQTSQPAPQPRPQPTTRSTSRAEPKPRPTTRTAPPQRRQERSEPTPRRTQQPARDPGASRRFEKAFEGAGESTTTSETATPADRLGPTALASLEGAIARQVKIRWQGRAPQGPDAEKLVTRVRFSLNPDGSLAGTPQAVGETLGVTPLNQNQVSRHREEAVRTIRLIGRFNLPIEVPPSQNTFTIRFEKD